MDLRNIIPILLICILVLFSGCTKQTTDCLGSTKPRETICKLDPVTNSEVCKLFVPNDAKCINIDESKNKLTIIIRENGAYNTDSIRNKILIFLDSVKSDVSVDNVGISYFSGKTLGELDAFIEKLYCAKDVGYIILLGDDFLEFMEGGALEYAPWYYDLSLVGKSFYTYENKEEEEPNPDRFCKDVAISWILPPVLYSNLEKINFTEKVIERYTKYHNENALLATHFSHLHIQWDVKSLGGDESLIDPPRAFMTNNTKVVYNADHTAVLRELTKKPYFLSLTVHGNSMEMGMGLTLDPNDPDRVYTSIEEFKQYVSIYGNPAVIIQTTQVCGSGTVSHESDYDCCWPQAFMEAGVWAQVDWPAIPSAYKRGTFIGDYIRHAEMDSYRVYGDITAH